MNALPAGCPPAGCIVPIARFLAAFPAWTWPVLASAWLAGCVLTARLRYGKPLMAGRWYPEGDGTYRCLDPVSPGAALAEGAAWPAWVPVWLAAVSLRWVWALVTALLFGDLGR